VKLETGNLKPEKSRRLGRVAVSRRSLVVAIIGVAADQWRGGPGKPPPLVVPGIPRNVADFPAGLNALFYRA